MRMCCTRCGHVGEPAQSTPGSFSIEVVLWLAFLLPGLVYSLWRLNARREVCAACGSDQIVPADTPRGEEIAAGSGRQLPASPAYRGDLGYGLGRRAGRLLGRLFTRR